MMGRERVTNYEITVPGENMVVSFLDFLSDIYISCQDNGKAKKPINVDRNKQKTTTTTPRIKGPGKGKDKEDKKISEHNQSSSTYPSKG